MLLLSLLGLVAAQPVAAESRLRGTGVGTMMDGMWEMMEWFLEQRDARAVPSQYAYTGATNGWGGDTTTGWWGSSGWEDTLLGDDEALQQREQWQSSRGYWAMDSVGTGYDNPGAPPQALEGLWLASSGEYWWVQNGRFILYSPRGHVLSGQLAVEGEWISAFHAENGQPARYRYRQLDDVLLVKDRHGQLMLLRKVAQDRAPVIPW